MTVTLNIPDEVSADLIASFGRPDRAALEALAAEAYERGVFSLAQVRTLLGLDSRWAAQEILSQHGVWPGGTADDLRSDLETIEQLTSS